MKIKDITIYKKPTPYAAVEVGEYMYEVKLTHWFAYLMTDNKPLADYYNNNTRLKNCIDLYYDLESLGFPIQEELIRYIKSSDYLDSAEPIPSKHYPLILKYYNGTATFRDLLLLQAIFGTDLGATPDFDFGDTPPDDWDPSPPF